MVGHLGPVVRRSLRLPDDVRVLARPREADPDARAKAQVLADASGLHVGAVASVEENGGSAPLPFADKAAVGSAPIEVGTQQITASVTVVFEAS